MRIEAHCRGRPDLLSLSAMPQFDPNGDPAPLPKRVRVGQTVKIEAMLYLLALQYWSEERPADALRVGRQAAEILRSDRSDSALLAEVTSMLGAISQELGPEGGPAPSPAQSPGFARAPARSVQMSEERADVESSQDEEGRDE